MTEIKFIDEIHKSFYEKMIHKTGSQNDVYRKSFFYAVGLTDDTRDNIGTIYDFEGNGILVEGLNCGWQTSTSTRITQLAFNLYCNYTGEEDSDARDYSVENIFCDSLREFMFEAVRLRYPR